MKGTVGDMFIYTCRAGTIRFFAVIVLAAAALAALVIFVPAYQPVSAGTGTESGSGDAVKVSYDKIKTNEDRVRFLSQFGYEVAEDPLETAEITIPEKFDKVYAGYNEIQKAQGLDLSKYRRKTVMRYTYEVKNYDGYNGGRVLANVIVYRGRVIGGDICSANPQGFVHGFEGAIKMQ